MVDNMTDYEDWTSPIKSDIVELKTITDDLKNITDNMKQIVAKAAPEGTEKVR